MILLSVADLVNFLDLSLRKIRFFLVPVLRASLKFVPKRDHNGGLLKMSIVHEDYLIHGGYNLIKWFIVVVHISDFFNTCKFEYLLSRRNFPKFTRLFEMG